jgi:hypothetical protein
MLTFIFAVTIPARPSRRCRRGWRDGHLRRWSGSARNCWCGRRARIRRCVATRQACLALADLVEVTFAQDQQPPPVR